MCIKWLNEEKNEQIRADTYNNYVRKIDCFGKMKNQYRFTLLPHILNWKRRRKNNQLKLHLRRWQWKEKEKKGKFSRERRNPNVLAHTQSTQRTREGKISTQNVNTCNCIIQFQFIIHNCSRELLLLLVFFPHSWALGFFCLFYVCLCSIFYFYLILKLLRFDHRPRRPSRHHIISLSSFPSSFSLLMQISIVAHRQLIGILFAFIRTCCMCVRAIEWVSFHKFVAEHNQISICKTYSSNRRRERRRRRRQCIDYWIKL